MNAAAQERKYVVLYFESAGSESCARMDAETWPKFGPALSGKVLWKKFQYGRDDKSFEHFTVNQTPHIVIIDPQQGERGRMAEFTPYDGLAAVLEALPPVEDLGIPLVTTFGDGKVFPFDPEKPPASQLILEHAYHINESFEAVQRLVALDSALYDVVVNPAQTMRIEAGRGYGSGTGLLVTGVHGNTASDRINPAASIRLCLSKDFKDSQKTQLVRGFLEVRFRISVIQLPEDDSPMEVAALTILPANSSPPTVEEVRGKHRAHSLFVERKLSQTGWDEIVLRTREPVLFSQSSAWLNLWVDGVMMGVAVDDIRVRLLPKDSPYAEPPKEEGVNPEELIPKTPPSRRFQKLDPDGDRKILKSEFVPAKRDRIE